MFWHLISKIKFSYHQDSNYVNLRTILVVILFVFPFLVTLEFILALAVSIPLIFIPLFILIVRHRHEQCKGKYTNKCRSYHSLPYVNIQ